MKTLLQLIFTVALFSLLFYSSSYAQGTSNQAGNVIGKARVVNYSANETLHQPDLLVSTKGGVQNVVITIEDITGAFKEDPIEIDQKNMAYSPRIAVTMVGNEIVFLNSDALLHNVHTFQRDEPVFNVVMPKINTTYQYETAEAGLMKVQCDVHPGMEGYVMVTSNPYYAVTNSGGLFQINSLPVGTYKFKAWHEKLGTAEKEVTVKAGEKTAVIFDFTTEVALNQ